jgi:hypothetical protein
VKFQPGRKRHAKAAKFAKKLFPFVAFVPFARHQVFLCDCIVKNVFQISTNALAKSRGFSSTHFVTNSGANHAPVSISSGCKTNGPSLSQR